VFALAAGIPRLTKIWATTHVCSEARIKKGTVKTGPKVRQQIKKVESNNC